MCSDVKNAKRYLLQKEQRPAILFGPHVYRCTDVKEA
jgi:hypothetical protein